jgi:hypothetical protein
MTGNSLQTLFFHVKCKCLVTVENTEQLPCPEQEENSHRAGKAGVTVETVTEQEEEGGQLWQYW